MIRLAKIAHSIKEPYIPRLAESLIPAVLSTENQPLLVPSTEKKKSFFYHFITAKGLASSSPPVKNS